MKAPHIHRYDLVTSQVTANAISSYVPNCLTVRFNLRKLRDTLQRAM